MVNFDKQIRLLSFKVWNLTDNENVAAAAAPDSPLAFPLKNLIQNWLGDQNGESQSQPKTELPFPTTVPRPLTNQPTQRGQQMKRKYLF